MMSYKISCIAWNIDEDSPTEKDIESITGLFKSGISLRLYRMKKQNKAKMFEDLLD